MGERWGHAMESGAYRLGIHLYVDDSDVEPSFQRYNQNLQEAEAQTLQFQQTVNAATRRGGEYYAAAADDVDAWRQAAGTALQGAEDDLLGYTQAVRTAADRWADMTRAGGGDWAAYIQNNIGRVNADWGDYIDQLEINEQMQAKFYTGSRDQLLRFAGVHEKTMRGAKKATSDSVGGQIRDLRTLRWELITMMFFFRLFMQAVQAAWEGIKAAHEASVREGGLEALAESYDRSASAIVDSLERVSQGSLDTREAVKIAQQGLVATNGQFVSSFDDLYQAAEVVSVTVGTDVPQAFSSLAEAINEADAEAVDSVASWFNAEEAVLDYAGSTGQLVEELTDQEVQQVLLQRVQERTNQLLADGADEAVEQERAVGRLKASWGDLRDGFIATSGAGEGVQYFLNGLSDLIDNAANVTVALTALFKALFAVRREVQTGRFRMWSELLAGEDPTTLWEVFYETMRESLRDGLEALGYYNDELDETGDAIQTLGDVSNEVSEQDIELLEERLELYRRLAEEVRQAEREMERALEDMETERQRTVDDILLDAARDREKIEIDLRRKLEDINRKYERKIEDAEEDNRDRRAKIERKYRDRLITIEERYLERLRRIQEDYQMSLWEAIGERDATAALKAQRERNLQMRRAGRDRDQERREARRDYERQLADLRDALESQRREAERQRERAREDAEIARRRAREDAQRAYEQEMQDLEIALRRQREDIKLNLERRREDLWDHFHQKMYIMGEQHAQEVAREQAFQNENLAAYEAYLRERLSYYENYMNQMGFDPTVGAQPSPYSGPYDTYGYGGYSPGYQHGGAFVARGRQQITVGEGNRAELVQIQPLRQATGSPRITPNVTGRIDHEVRGMVEAQMSDMSGQLTAVINQAVLQALSEVLV